MKTDCLRDSTLGCNGRLLLHAIIFLAGALSATAHVGAPPLSLQREVLPVAAVQQIALKPTDVTAELAADAKAGNLPPLRFAVAQNVVLTSTNSGTWEPLSNGRLWRLRIVSTNATDLNFGFTQYWLPEGASLHVMSEAEDYYQGPYTAADNTAAGQLWTPMVPGAGAIIEMFVPAGVKEEPRLVVAKSPPGRHGTRLLRVGHLGFYLPPPRRHTFRRALQVHCHCGRLLGLLRKALACLGQW